jgi:hypothetical protein
VTRLHLSVLLLVLWWHAPASAQTWACGSGTVRSVEAIDESVTRETIGTHRDGDGGVETFITRTDTQHRRRSYVLAVQLGDLLFTSESTGDPAGTLDPLQVVAGEPIQVCVNTVQMIVEAPDGTDYRAPVVRWGSVPQSVSVECRRSRKASSSGCR